MALTGQVFSPSTAEIKFVSSTELENLLEHLNSWAKSTGGSGTTASSNAGQTSISTTPNTIQLELIIFSGLSLIEMGPAEPSKKQFKKHMRRSMKKHIELLRAAKIELDKAGGV